MKIFTKASIKYFILAIISLTILLFFKNTAIGWEEKMVGKKVELNFSVQPPHYMSPNGDGCMDTLPFTIISEIKINCDHEMKKDYHINSNDYHLHAILAILDQNGNHVFGEDITEKLTLFSPGGCGFKHHGSEGIIYSGDIEWDGKDFYGYTVNDGLFTVSITVEIYKINSNGQEIFIESDIISKSFLVDTIPPDIIAYENTPKNGDGDYNCHYLYVRSENYSFGKHHRRHESDFNGIVIEYNDDLSGNDLRSLNLNIDGIESENLFVIFRDTAFLPINNQPAYDFEIATSLKDKACNSNGAYNWFGPVEDAIQVSSGLPKEQVCTMDVNALSQLISNRVMYFTNITQIIIPSTNPQNITDVISDIQDNFPKPSPYANIFIDSHANPSALRIIIPKPTEQFTFIALEEIYLPSEYENVDLELVRDDLRQKAIQHIENIRPSVFMGAISFTVIESDNKVIKVSNISDSVNSSSLSLNNPLFDSRLLKGWVIEAMESVAIKHPELDEFANLIKSNISGEFIKHPFPKDLKFRFKSGQWNTEPELKLTGKSEEQVLNQFGTLVSDSYRLLLNYLELPTEDNTNINQSSIVSQEFINNSFPTPPTTVVIDVLPGNCTDISFVGLYILNTNEIVLNPIAMPYIDQILQLLASIGIYPSSGIDENLFSNAMDLIMAILSPALQNINYSKFENINHLLEPGNPDVSIIPGGYNVTSNMLGASIEIAGPMSQTALGISVLGIDASENIFTSGNQPWPIGPCSGPCGTVCWGSCGQGPCGPSQQIPSSFISKHIKEYRIMYYLIFTGIPFAVLILFRRKLTKKK